MSKFSNNHKHTLTQDNSKWKKKKKPEEKQTIITQTVLE